MAIIKTDDKNYQNIAKEIRNHTQENETYTPAQMPEGIQKVYQKGYEEGEAVGYAVGHTDGFGYGEESERRQFWDLYQQDGDRTDYSFAFAGAGWTEETFWPNRDITIHNGYEMFAYCGFAGSLKARLQACKVQLKFGGNETLMNLFAYADKITELGVIDMSEVISSTSNTHIFKQCKALHTIEKLILPNGQSSWNGWFTGCAALENIIFEGIISKTGLDLSDCPKLTRESMLSILNCLTNAVGLSGTWKVTLGATNLAKLSESDKAIATAKGWTLA